MFCKEFDLLIIVYLLLRLLMTYLSLVILVIRSLILDLLLLLHLLFFPYQTYLLCFLVIWFHVLVSFDLVKDLRYIFDDLVFILNFKFHLASFLDFFLFINQMLKSLKFFPFFMMLLFLFMEISHLNLINLQFISIKIRFFRIFYLEFHFNQ